MLKVCNIKNLIAFVMMIKKFEQKGVILQNLSKNMMWKSMELEL